jgi:SepF-like predicted cell division protein (DUF552 family)
MKFKPGQSGNPAGKPQGARNKLSNAFLEAMRKDFEEHGEAAIRVARIEKPTEYLRTIASIIPKEFEITHTNAVKELSDDELEAFISQLRSVRRDAGEAGDGEEPTTH